MRDGEPLGTITVIAVGTGILVACLLLILIRSMVYEKKPLKKEGEEKKDKKADESFNFNNKSSNNLQSDWI